MSRGKVGAAMPSEQSPQPSDGSVPIEEFLANRTLIVASNRGPVTFSYSDDGTFTSRKGSGGVVTAVSAIARDRQPLWIAAAMTDGDRARAEVARRTGEGLISPPGQKSEFRVQFVGPEPEVYHKYYNIISNPLLWFLQHYLWDTSRAPDIDQETWDAWENGYVTVNQLFADEVLAAAGAQWLGEGGPAAAEQGEDEPIIMLQDYHLYLAAGMIREKRPTALLQ